MPDVGVQMLDSCPTPPGRRNRVDVGVAGQDAESPLDMSPTPPRRRNRVEVGWSAVDDGEQHVMWLYLTMERD